MSRHRDIRNRAYSYEDYDDYDYYSEEEANSPTANEFMYHRDSPNQQRSVFSFTEQPPAASSSDQADDTEIIASMLPQVKAAVGTKFTDDQIAEELRTSNYDVSTTVIDLLERAKTTSPRRGNLPLQVPMPNLESVASQIDSEGSKSTATTTAIGSNPPVAKTAAIGGTLPVAKTAAIGGTPAPSPPRKTVTEAPIVPEAKPSTSSQSAQFTPHELKQFEKQEAKTQEACVRMLEQESETNAKTRLNMVVVGHVDAGKSTITGHLLYKLGYVSQKMMHKFKKDSDAVGKSSFAYAWVMDADDEERTRGVTMDVGTSYFETETKSVTLLDAPGHKDFIPKMIAGATQADVAVLVVPAVTGEFEAAFENSGQTKEHTLLIRSLGVTQLIVAVNKMDAVEWSQERFDGIVASMTTFLKGAGFKESKVWFIPVSGISGANLDEKVDAGACSWYDGPSLVKAIDRFSPPARQTAKPFRMSISDVSKSMSLGLTLSGRVNAGAASVGDTFLFMPVTMPLTIKGMEQNGQAITLAKAGDSVDIGVSGIDPSALSTGSILCSVPNPVRLVKRFEAKIMTMPAVEVPIVKGTSLTLHIHNVDEPVNVTRLVSLLNKTGEVQKKKPRCITKETSAVVQITSHRRICLETFSDYRQLGRFTLRDRGTTLAAGVVTEVLR